ncbi:uncharacterized protein AAGF69_013927 isoform 7-T11 [Amazona ochrocephala]
MRPQEKLLFKSPAAIALQHLASITQVWRFQRAQAELMLASHRHAARRHRAAMEEAKRELSVKESSPLAGEGAAGDPLPMGIYGGLWGTSLPLITPLCPTQEQHPPAHRGHIPGTHSDPAAPAATQLPGGQPSPSFCTHHGLHPSCRPCCRGNGCASSSAILRSKMALEGVVQANVTSRPVPSSRGSQRCGTLPAPPSPPASPSPPGAAAAAATHPPPARHRYSGLHAAPWHGACG